MECENNFTNNVMRDDTGRYVVRLPFKTKSQLLGSYLQQAVKLFTSLENKLIKNKEFKIMYSQFIQEYLYLGHMTFVSQWNETDDHQNCYYLPHHAVFKETSASTKLRVVFDGLAKITADTRFNNTLLIGPTIQQDLFSILTRFWTQKDALTADIQKLYRQILINSRIKIFSGSFGAITDQLQIFKLNTVIYGTASAPFL